MLNIYENGANKMADRILDVVSECKAADGAILVFLHRNVDGDCIGSATGLVSVLRALGANAYVAMCEKIPGYLSFFEVDDLLYYPEEDFLTHKTIDGKKVIRAISVDCTEGSRMGAMESVYDSFENNLTIDHHEVTHLENEFKWIVPNASSASELVYYVTLALCEKLSIKISELIDKRAANSILAGIISDTGRFTFKNTNPETLSVAGDLMGLGGDISSLSYNLFDKKVKTEFLISNAACVRSEFYFDGKIAITTVTQKMFDEFEATADQIGDVVSRLRDIDGVELAIVLREAGDGVVRGNLRSKSYFDCTKLAGNFGGGGHIRASGFHVDDVEIMKVKEAVLDIASTMLE